MRKLHRSILIGIAWAMIALLPKGNLKAALYNETREKSEVKRVIEQMERYYERRRVSQFMALFSRRKFPNLIAFRNAVENDFNMNRNVRLRRTSERLTVSKGMAVHQALWHKQYMPMITSPLEGKSKMKRISGTVRIYLEKEGQTWKIINIQGYPIFGL